ncbi:MAG TPA: hypothetical protein VH143_05325 [Kofleriaceae bacterium]|jgi:hypothetical protein|nr:hypothetical protein [Kofleriaceae bacterium]
MTRYLSFCLLALAASACTGAEANTSTPTAAPQKAQASATSAADHDLCVAVMAHSRTCTEQYIPVLVDARAQVDHPAGIKDAVAKDRTGVIAQAKQEWSTDSTDESIEAMCQKPMPNADAQRDAVTACQAKTDCGEFSACIVPVEAQSWH